MGVSTAPKSLWSGCRRGQKSEPLDVEAAPLAASVAVMAPALTEGGPQKPENLLPSLPIGGFLSPKQASKICQNREVLAKFVVSANVQPSKIDDQFLLGVSKDLIRDVINSKFSSGLDNLSGFENLSGFANGSDLISDKDFAFEKDLEDELPVVPDKEPQTTVIIMNDPSMDEQADNMCFLKSSDVPLADSGPTSDEKTLDVDQIMGFGDEKITDPSASEVTDIGENVEDILQVIKSMEGAENAESIAVSSEPAQSVADSVEMFSSFEQNLLSDVDFVGLCTDYGNPTEEIEQLKIQNLKSHEDLVRQNQFENEKRCSFLLRRLRKLQARLVGRHVAEENTGVLEIAHNGVKQYFFQELAGIGSKSAARSSPEVNSSMNNFLEKIEKTCATQSSSVNRQRSCCRYFGAGSRDNSGAGAGSSSRHPAFTASQINIKGEEVEKVAGPLATHLHLVESNLDSDCTASSSGGESCDEMQPFNNLHQEKLSM